MLKQYLNVRRLKEEVMEDALKERRAAQVEEETVKKSLAGRRQEMALAMLSTRQEKIEAELAAIPDDQQIKQLNASMLCLLDAAGGTGAMIPEGPLEADAIEAAREHGAEAESVAALAMVFPSISQGSKDVALAVFLQSYERSVYGSLCLECLLAGGANPAEAESPHLSAYEVALERNDEALLETLLVKSVGESRIRALECGFRSLKMVKEKGRANKYAIIEKVLSNAVNKFTFTAGQGSGFSGKHHEIRPGSPGLHDARYAGEGAGARLLSLAAEAGEVAFVDLLLARGARASGVTGLLQKIIKITTLPYEEDEKQVCS